MSLAFHTSLYLLALSLSLISLLRAVSAIVFSSQFISIVSGK
jgi:hypothetical protein